MHARTPPHGPRFRPRTIGHGLDLCPVRSLLLPQAGGSAIKIIEPLDLGQEDRLSSQRRLDAGRLYRQRGRDRGGGDGSGSAPMRASRRVIVFMVMLL